MLVLTRRRKAGIMVSGGIRIVVVDIRGDKVRLGIEAPDGVVIMRDELVKWLDPETQSALGANKDVAQAKS